MDTSSVLFLLSAFLALLHVPGLFEDFSKNVKSILPITLNYDHHDKSTQNHITTQILDFYFNNAAPSREKYENVTSVMTNDSFFNHNFKN